MGLAALAEATPGKRKGEGYIIGRWNQKTKQNNKNKRKNVFFMVEITGFHRVKAASLHLVQRLLKFSVMKVAGLFCRVDYWRPQQYLPVCVCVANNDNLCSFSCF